MARTLIDVINRADQKAPAIGAPGRPSLPYGDFAALIGSAGAAINAAGAGRGDAVAIVLPNGPEMAAAFCAVAACATSAPLNPDYKADEFRFYLEDLGAKAIVLAAGSETPARAVARDLGITILDLHPGTDGPAGAFRLTGGGTGAAARPGLAEPGDVGLVLHTSGTTSRPKIVPLSHANLVASARNIGATLGLTSADLCLNIMPLFHIHGLIAAVSATLGAGACVSCTPGFNALKFFGWLDEVKPTWYTAVPTMHQAILARAPRNEASIKAARLRIIRSSSASLPPAVMLELEKTFGCPVIESYGMTEAAHQMASNPLPPRQRKPGSVGVAAGPEVGIMDDHGAFLPAGSIGEVVIRGENVTSGYLNNPGANATAFTNGWFRTGDQGMLDAEGYLTITGRLKEIINRGGEKVAPLEVDNVLNDHPAVRQVLTFAMPHDKLGEEVAAAVVLAEGASATENEIRAFASERLAGFKVPRRIVFVTEIPKGATGKLQRIGLAGKLGLTE
ncbi:MAG: AMP-binding protein [Methylocystis sp.]|nr:AMP-binding protein [Methylocystis sp.]MCA3584984.1 AMP-binding protein [Methylocystis sp.]MCA3586914.1 AMP-binding protein [Methylocystis sp.]MCA3592202.1 AMP-binding protein [Methylocystis sp.]